MQIELIGCTGAGKSTFASHLFRLAGHKQVKLASGNDVALRQSPRDRTSSKWLNAALLHVTAGNACLWHGWQYREFLHLSRHVLRDTAISPWQQWNQMRKILKQLGRFELIRQQPERRRVVLVDEGTIQSAHNVFVHLGYSANTQQVRDFSACVPLPDVIVYLRSARECLIERTLRRGHRRIPDGKRESVEWFVDQASGVFEQIVNCQRVASRTIIVDQNADAIQADGTTLGPVRRILPLIQSVLDYAKESRKALGMTLAGAVR